MESLYHSVPTDPTEMGNIKLNIQKLIQNEDSISECKLNFRDIDSAIMKLNKKKGDCNYGFTLIILFYLLINLKRLYLCS